MLGPHLRPSKLRLLERATRCDMQVTLNKVQMQPQLHKLGHFCVHARA